MAGFVQDEDLLPPDAPDSPGALPRWWDVLAAKRAAATPPTVLADAPTPANIPQDTAPIDGAVAPTPSAVPGRIPVVADREDKADALANAVAAKPKEQQPKWWQRLAAAGVGAAAGYANAEGKLRHPVDASGAIDAIYDVPGQQRRLSDWQTQVGGAQAAADAAKTKEEGWWKNRQLANADTAQEANTEHTKAQTGLVKQQMATMAEEGKRAPKGNFIAVGGGLFNAETGEWVKQPIDKTNLFEVDPEKAKMLGVQPTQDGKYYLPKEAMGQYIAGQLKPAPAPKDVNAVQLAIRAAGGDPSNPDSITPAIAAKASQILKPPAAGGGGVTLTPEAMDYWAKFAGTTGQLPSLGMGNAGAKAREQILNRAPQMATGDVAANRATNRADAGSLAGMQKMRDAVGAFEKTALANLELFTNQAKSIVDSGSPLVNTPLRAINRQLLGSKEGAAFDAARQVALTEIAKVVNNPNLSGQLSDSARHEVSGLIPDNATLGQIYHVVQVLKQDMANRKKYLDEGLSEIKGRMGGQQPPASGAGVANPNPNGYVAGHVYGGMTYLGGDPNSAASWKK